MGNEGNGLQGLKAELARLQARVDEMERAEHRDPAMSRRTAFKALGAAAAGAAVSTIAFAAPGGAQVSGQADGGNVIIGNDTQTAQSPTVLRVSGYATDAKFGAFTVSDESGTPSNNSAAGSAALVGIATGNPLTTGLVAGGSTYGAKLDGPTPLKLSDQSNSGAPSLGSGTRGMFRFASGDLWYCVTSSGSDRWRRLATGDTAGAFTAIDPARVYDSRWTGVAGLTLGPLSTGNSRVISVATKRNSTGGVVTNNIVPSGARAITYNLTVANTVTAGFLAVVPGNVGTSDTSVINWSASGQAIANASTVKLDTSRQVRVICGGPGATDFIIDVTGYYL